MSFLVKPSLNLLDGICRTGQRLCPHRCDGANAKDSGMGLALQMDNEYDDVFL